MKKKKIILLTIILIVFLSIASATILAAYYGKGVFKDVFVNREYYFASNTLRKIDSLEESNDISLSTKVSYGDDRQMVVIYNYNQDTGEFQNYDVHFTLYAWLDTDFTDADRSYELAISGVDDRITLDNSSPKYTSSVPSPIAEDLLLEGNQMSAVTLTIDYQIEQNEDVTTLPKVVVAAKVTSPRFMTNRMLGGKFIASRGEDFSLDHASFVKTCSDKATTACTTKEYAAFLYEIVCLGNPKATDQLVIKYDAAKITLDKNSRFYTDSPVVVDELTVITITNPEDNYMEQIMFYRNTESDVWENEKDDNTSWEELLSYIQTELVREEE